MTTVGYGDVLPTNDNEVLFVVIAELLTALIFGYMLSNVGSLVASLDRQQAVVEKQSDAIKEYIEWRQLPKPLGMRIKKHVEYFYQKNRGFDEVDIIEGLAPKLRADVTRFVLQETLGKVSLFADVFDTNFQLEIFPYIKPITYMSREVIYRKGESPLQLFFLLEGEVNIVSPFSDTRVSGIITKDSETILDNDGKPVVTLKGHGAFGETALTGARRPMTYVARTFIETLAIDGEDLATVFERNRVAGQQLANKLRRTAGRQQRLRHLANKFLIGSLPPESEVRAALIIQVKWYLVQMTTSSKEAPLARLAATAPQSTQEISRTKMLNGLEAQVVGAIRGVDTASRSPKRTPRARRASDLVNVLVAERRSTRDSQAGGAATGTTSQRLGASSFRGEAAL